jgi:hypothetical protein
MQIYASWWDVSAKTYWFYFLFIFSLVQFFGNVFHLNNNMQRGDENEWKKQQSAHSRHQSARGKNWIFIHKIFWKLSETFDIQIWSMRFAGKGKVFTECSCANLWKFLNPFLQMQGRKKLFQFIFMILNFVLKLD